MFNCAFNVTDSYYDVKVKGILEDKMKFELELFCGDLCRMGIDVGVPIPYTQKAYEKLKILQPM